MKRSELAAQFSQVISNSRLRMGLLSIVAILWAYGLMLMSDQAVLWRTDSNSLREELKRLQPLSKERGWSERAEDARQQLAAIRGMRWTEADLGLVEAKFQDWIRNASAKSGLPLRELTVVRSAPSTAKTPGDEPHMIKARLLVDFNRMTILGFLVEVGRSERVIAVDRLALRLSSQPSVAEIELRILGAVPSSQEAR